MSLKNEIALVTGGSRGIGRAICQRLAIDLKCHVLINYNRNEEAALETLRLIELNKGTASIIQFDVGNKEEVDNALDRWYTDNPNKVIDTLINNAGITKDNLMVFMSPQDWKEVMNINLNGFYNVTHKLLQPMILKRFGRIVNIVSVAALKGNTGQTNYSAAKGAIISATKSLSQEIAKRNITVNAVAAGFIRTDMTNDLNESELKKLIPMNRFGTPDEVANVVSFLASDRASYITGEIINVNGGIYS